MSKMPEIAILEVFSDLGVVFTFDAINTQKKLSKPLNSSIKDMVDLKSELLVCAEPAIIYQIGQL